MLPELFYDRLRLILREDLFSNVVRTFDLQRPASVRANTLTISPEEAGALLRQQGLAVDRVAWLEEGMILRGGDPADLSRMEAICQGRVYIQSLASMLPALILDPQPGEHVLDLCAAPGSKTTQMAARMLGQGDIVAVESVRARYYRLRSVISLLGATNVRAKCVDGRRFRSQGAGFDKILVDVPCSSEARFHTNDPQTFAYWSLRKIREMVQKQRGLLLNAWRLLKPGGVLVYSTCTFAPEENEGVIDWLLKKVPENIEIAPIEIPGIACYPPVIKWGGRSYDPRVSGCFRVLPTDIMEGFFITKLIKRH